jgi:hypothetical protein
MSMGEEICNFKSFSLAKSFDAGQSRIGRRSNSRMRSAVRKACSQIASNDESQYHHIGETADSVAVDAPLWDCSARASSSRVAEFARAWGA